MLIDDDTVEKYIVNISAGSSIVLIDDSVVVFKYPSNFVKLRADFVYDVEYAKAIKQGFLDKVSLEKLIEERKIFSNEDQVKLNGLISKLEAQKVLLSKTLLVEANKNRIKNTIKDLEERISSLLYKRTSILMMSAEAKAEEEKTLYLCWKSTFSEDEHLFWKTFEEFKYTTLIEFRNNVLTMFNEFYSGISTDKIRYIARHSLWRIRYVNSQKTGEALFGVPSAEYTTDMLNLAYWSNYYDNIYQMMPEDRPSDLLIEDDVALDAYMRSYYEERNRENASRKSKSSTSGKLSAFDSEEVIVTASNELWQDIDYTKPREAQKIKDRKDLRKRTKRG